MPRRRRKKKKEGKPVLLGKVKRPDLQIDMLKKKEAPDVLCVRIIESNPNIRTFVNKVVQVL
jgi:hypothetical protein